MTALRQEDDGPNIQDEFGRRECEYLLRKAGFGFVRAIFARENGRWFFTDEAIEWCRQRNSAAP